MRISLPGAASRLLLVFGLAGLASGCDSLLEVDNPATYAAEDLNDPAVAPVMVNGVLARFNAMYDDLALYSAIITDEAVTGHNFETIQRVDLRQITKLNSDVYAALQFTRAAADSFEARLVRIQPDSANRALGIARVQAYGAMTYVLLGEFLCLAPIEGTQDAISSDSMFRIAISTANRAIATGTASSTSGSGVRGDSMVALARLAAARAHLNLGEKAQAATFAALVPYDTIQPLEFRANYNILNLNSVFFGSTSGTNHNLGVDVAFRNLNDPRVRHFAQGRTGHDQRTILFTPFQGPSFSGYAPTATGGAAFTREGSIRFASGLEARYILAEAQGVNAANLTFINRRRLIGNQAPLVSPTEAQFLAAVMDQRRRDFFLDGHRIGDLRRYKRLYSQNFFPTGAHPTPDRGNYGTDECFVPTQAEITGNPGYNPAP
ncbi:MAG TPA: hypothetical protein VE913_07075 [Longimicrobium sp.]|nr:hypothetical protein [Longimicrobium sp.]